MAKKNELIAAVDFGSRAVRIVITRRAPDGQTRILGYGVEPTQGCIRFGAIQDLNAATQAFRAAFNTAKKMAGTSVSALYCGIHGAKISTNVSEGRVPIENKIIKPEHLETARKNAATASIGAKTRALSSFMSEEWTVDDVRVTDPLDMHGSVLKVRIHFAQIPEFVENNLRRCIETQGLLIEEFVFMPLAAASGCLTCEDIQMGVAVVDLGAAAADIAVYTNNDIAVATAYNWGSGLIINDITAGIKVSFEEATELLLEYGVSDHRIRLLDRNTTRSDSERKGASAKENAPIKLTRTVTGAPSTVPRSELDAIIFARCDEIAEKVQHFLNKNNLLDRLARGIVLTGGGAGIHNLDTLFGIICDIPVRVGVPLGFDDLPESLDLPEWTPVMGIIKHAMERRSAMEKGQLSPQGNNNSWYARIRRLLGKYFV
ncbi:MAG: cell division protein FtsA [Candidatus Hydrogenedentes bacterium]|nr:cell division protein FtsA [Candidatus Hydrogenedentota bacterium]